MRLYLVKTDAGTVIGWGPEDTEYLARLEPGECIEAETRKARNPGHHRKFFALLQSAFVGQSRYKRLEDLLIEMKLRAGWYEEHITADGKLVYVPKSISWAQMDQQEFDRFYAEAIVALAEMFGSEEVVMEADRIIAHRAVGQEVGG